MSITAVSNDSGNQGVTRGARADLRNASDDEILGIDPVHAAQPGKGAKDGGPGEMTEDVMGGDESDGTNARTLEDEDGAEKGEEDSREPAELKGILEANPELRRAWEDASEYRQVFATPEEARKATALVADLNRLDGMFFSKKAEDHARLARSIADADPDAFASLVRAMSALAADLAGGKSGAEARGAKDGGPKSGDKLDAERNLSGEDRSGQNTGELRRTEQNSERGAGLSAEQTGFLQAANAAAVQSVIGAIEAQVERLLPEGASKSAKNRVVGEIYRELDGTLGGNRQLSQQVRDAFRSGGLDAEHQRAIVSLITGKARQALPNVAKKVINEWTSTVIAANQDRRARQLAAERRVDIAGSGGSGRDGLKSMSPREIDYARMSDGDILNL